MHQRVWRGIPFIFKGGALHLIHN